MLGAVLPPPLASLTSLRSTLLLRDLVGDFDGGDPLTKDVARKSAERFLAGGVAEDMNKTTPPVMADGDRAST